MLLFSVSKIGGRVTLCLLILFLMRFGLLSGHLLGKSCSLGLPYVLFVLSLFVILVISRYCFEGLIWVLIALVPIIAYLLICIIYTKRSYSTQQFFSVLP